MTGFIQVLSPGFRSPATAEETLEGDEQTILLAVKAAEGRTPRIRVDAEVSLFLCDPRECPYAKQSESQRRQPRRPQGATAERCRTILANGEIFRSPKSSLASGRSVRMFT